MSSETCFLLGDSLVFDHEEHAVRQEDIHSSPPSQLKAMSVVQQPLPAPPAGHVWKCIDDGVYEVSLSGSTDEEQQPLVIEHLVMPEDTLQGICLRYRAPLLEVRRHNFLSANKIHHLSVLKVPIKPNTPLQLQPASQDTTLRMFTNLTGEGSTEAKLYLEESNFDLQEDAWKSDEEWMRQRLAAKENGEQAPVVSIIGVPDKGSRWGAAAGTTASRSGTLVRRRPSNNSSAM